MHSRPIRQEALSCVPFSGNSSRVFGGATRMPQLYQKTNKPEPSFGCRVTHRYGFWWRFISSTQRVLGKVKVRKGSNWWILHSRGKDGHVWRSLKKIRLFPELGHSYRAHTHEMPSVQTTDHQPDHRFVLDSVWTFVQSFLVVSWKNRDLLLLPQQQTQRIEFCFYFKNRSASWKAFSVWSGFSLSSWWGNNTTWGRVHTFFLMCGWMTHIIFL